MSTSKQSPEGKNLRGKAISLHPLGFREAVSDLLAVKPPPKWSSWKFTVGARVRANEKAPGDYRGLVGTVIERGPHKSEYAIRFDGHETLDYLNSWWLDAA